VSRLGQLLLGLALGLVVAEVALRVSGLGHPGLYIYDRYTGWKPRPNASVWQNYEGSAHVAYNSAGMRDRELSYQKAANTVRIAILGDSFTEAKHVPREQTFCAVIERDLASCPALNGKKPETLNFGCDSYGTAQELMTLRHRVWQFSPDVVVLAICTGNDIRNDSIDLEGNKCQPFFTYRDGELVLSGAFEESAWFRFQCMVRFDSQRSALLDFLGEMRSALRVGRRRRQLLEQLAKAGVTPPPGDSVGSEVGLDDWIYRAPATAAERAAWHVAEGEIEMVHREAAAHGARFLAVTLSNGVQVYPSASGRRDYMGRWGIQDNLFYPDYRIKALGEREGFAVLNLAPPFQQYADSHHVFLHGFTNTRLGTGHWNAQGHAYGATLIAQRLCDLLKQSAPSSSANAASSRPVPSP
jgi:hypothetical protein